MDAQPNMAENAYILQAGPAALERLANIGGAGTPRTVFANWAALALECCYQLDSGPLGLLHGPALRARLGECLKQLRQALVEMDRRLCEAEASYQECLTDLKIAESQPAEPGPFEALDKQSQRRKIEQQTVRFCNQRILYEELQQQIKCAENAVQIDGLGNFQNIGDVILAILNWARWNVHPEKMPRGESDPKAPPLTAEKSSKRKRRKREKRQTPTVQMMQAYTLWEAGSDYRTIGKTLGISHTAARNWVQLVIRWNKSRSVKARAQLPAEQHGSAVV